MALNEFKNLVLKDLKNQEISYICFLDENGDEGEIRRFVSKGKSGYLVKDAQGIAENVKWSEIVDTISRCRVIIDCC